MPDRDAHAPARNRLVFGLILAGSVAAAFTLGLLLTRRNEPAPLPDPRTVGPAAKAAGCEPIERPTKQGKVLVAVGAKHPAYSSNPPTSGWAIGRPLEPGIYETEQITERVVGNVNEGHIVVWFTGLTPRERGALSGLFAILKRNDLVAVPGESLELERGVVFTTYGMLQRCRTLSGAALVEFINGTGASPVPTASPTDGG